MHPTPLITALVSIFIAAEAASASQGDCGLQQGFELRAIDAAVADDFGFSVGLSGTIAVVGARYKDDVGFDSGSAYLFDTLTGSQIAKLVASDTASGDQFGGAVAISGSRAIVAAERDDDNGDHSGSAYIFDTTTGAQLHKLLPNDGATLDGFGRAVGISGNLAVVGALWDDDQGNSSGSAYVFDVTTGLQLAKLLASDGAANDHFGAAVAIRGSTVVVGADQNDGLANGAGAAYLYDATSGTELAKLLPSPGAVFDFFGSSVAIDGTRAVVGSIGDDDGGATAGAVYVFDTTTATQIAKFLPSVYGGIDRFGLSVGISGDLVVAGASLFAGGRGVADIFDLASGSWVQRISLDQPHGGDSLADSVAVSGTTVLLGAPGREHSFTLGTNEGSAFLFSLQSQGTNYCAVNPNSTGAAAIISGAGSTSLAAAEFCLSAAPVPNEFFLFFYGDTQVETPLGNGNLCAAGNIIRLGPPALASGNVAHRTLDVPVELGTVGTVHFQCWFRDPLGGGALFNLSDGLTVSFVP